MGSKAGSKERISKDQEPSTLRSSWLFHGLLRRRLLNVKSKPEVVYVIKYYLYLFKNTRVIGQYIPLLSLF